MAVRVVQALCEGLVRDVLVQLLEAWGQAGMLTTSVAVLRTLAEEGDSTASTVAVPAITAVTSSKPVTVPSSLPTHHHTDRLAIEQDLNF
jgi:hypothetical protein